jgi:glycosyltransferase involved in cell wall biosynthesis
LIGTTPLVSIGLPVYNGERFLPRALDSLLAQTFTDFELVISDNASTDKTSEICQAYQTKDVRVRYYCNEKNMGMGWNFDRVIELSLAPYFMYAADDDWWEPDFIRLLFHELEIHPEAAVALSSLDIVDEEGNLIKPVRLDIGDKSPNELGYLGMFLRLMILWGEGTKSHHYYMYALSRKDFVKDIRRFVVRGLFVDRMLVATMALATRFRYVNRVLFYKTRHSRNMFARYPDENFSKAVGSYFTLFKIPFRFGYQLWRCDIIPPWRKLYIPLAILGMAKIITAWIYTHKLRKTNS